MDAYSVSEMARDLYSLLLIVNRKVFHTQDFAKALPFPISHLKVLITLKNKGSMPISTLAKSLEISRPNMTPIIDKLIEEGNVIRMNDPSDRRIIVITLSDKGHELIRTIEIQMQENLGEMFKTLSSDQLNEFHTAIKTITDIINTV